MAPSDSEDETPEELEYDVDDEPEADGEDEPLDVAPDDATEEGDDESASDDSEDGSEDDDEDDDNDSENFAETIMDVDQVGTKSESLPDKKSPSPAEIASSPNDDGYIRDYDIFSAVNSKIFLTAPQRHHSGVVEGIMKAGQLRFWWENPALPVSTQLSTTPGLAAAEPPPLSPVYSLAMHSDALWTLAGTDTGHINLFTTRHDPGRVFCAMTGHRGPVSALSMSYDEKGFFSAGWDGDAIQWDLNTGQRVRTFTAHGAQLAAIAVRPLGSVHSEISQMDAQSSEQDMKGPESTILPNLPDVPLGGSSKKEPADSDANSDASFDPLFDDEPEDEPSTANAGALNSQQPPLKATLGLIPPPKNAPPLLDSVTYSTYSPDLFMTASIDGQVILWDRRVDTTGSGVGRLWMSEKTPPWCLSACWSADGGQLYAGRRNGTVDVWDVQLLGRSGPRSTPRLLKTLRNPLSSGVVSCVVAFPDCRHIACASIDNLRLWNVTEASEPDSFGKAKSGVQFKIIPGHHGGHISQMLVDPGARFLVSASSNRGWHGDSTRTVFVHDIKQTR
ncbi:hypothetical protein H0H87_010791 [Tephrocybe sp. NHM501043]|nr:hypothetical protein H0H87_010791 [Tephrocybe sp. NHM501043]